VTTVTGPLADPASVLSQEDIDRGLGIARGLIEHGIPVFTGPPTTEARHTSGFILPGKWQETKPDLSVLDRWHPGDALCMVCGYGLDLVDIDIYHGGSMEALELRIKPMPRVYAVAATPSGGIHLFTSGLEVRSQNDMLPGIDVKSGDPNGKGRGFAFIAPTVKPSKMTGQLGKYTWIYT
jgi:hypothetical protein